MNTPKYRKISRVALDDLKKFDGSACVNIKTAQSILHLMGDMNLVIRQDERVVELDTTPTIKEIRKAFWALRGRREWGDKFGVVWTVLLDGVHHLGLGRMLPKDERLPVAVPVNVINYATTHA